jgi:dTDP-4-dehydrorhamnose reductase
MKKKLLVTGFGGFLAGSVMYHAKDSWEVHGLDKIKAPGSQNKLNYYSFDLRDFRKLKRIYYQIKPDAVIHTAAIADIDFCQSNQDLAQEVNVGVTQNLVDLCAESDAKMVFCSSDTVFDGEKELYKEDDLPRPLNYYAETKVKAENIIHERADNYVVIRISLIMGLPVMGAGNSFLARTIVKIKKGEKVGFPENEIRTPIDIITLGRALVELAGNSYQGIINLSGMDRLNRYEMAQCIVTKLGYSEDLIVATDSNTMPGRARRPNDVSLSNIKAQQTLKTPMCT